MQKTHHVIFTPSGKRGQFQEGSSVLAAARSLGVDIDSVCGGRGICGRCQILLSEGDFPKFGIQSKAAHLIPLTEPELRFKARKGLNEGRRLSCHCKLLGDLVIDVPPESQVHKQIIRKRVGMQKLELDPVLKLYYVEVEIMDMQSPSSDLKRLKKALQEQWDLSGLELDPYLLKALQSVLREADHKITVAIYDQRAIVAIWPGLHTAVYGLAVDIGSTTIAAHLCNLSSGEVLASAGKMNPQIRFGEDLMSRVSYVMMNPSGSEELTLSVRSAINELAQSVALEAEVELENILELSLVGNPVMHHLLLGINPIELGGAPFALAIEEALWLRASDIGLTLHPAARAYVLPCIAGHVGADTAAMMLAENPQDLEEMTLLVDVGTNAEIVLGNKHKLAACSSPTGPALEGAQISAGQRAAAGAIERVRIDPETLEPRFKVIGCEYWSNEGEFKQASKDLTISGICGSGIIEVIAEMYLAKIIRSDGFIDGDRLNHPRISKDGATYRYLLYEGQPDKSDVSISITQQDIRAVQLAKAALFAGVNLLMDHLKVETIDRICLAGAFGSHIDTKYAMILGLIPDCDLAKVKSIGNAAGDGALQALLSRKARARVEQLVEQVEKIETAVEPKFQDYFVDALAIPNKTAAFPRLESALGITFAERNRSLDQTQTQQRRRRRRETATL